jgi:hypothetical protein
MKKLFLSFSAMLVSVATSAQSGITITPVSANYMNKTVTFNVSWLNSSRTGTHNSKVWVFVDYREVTNNAPSGSWTRATVSGTPTASSGTPTRETTTDKGFWLQGTSGTSGTYNSTVTVTLGNVPAKFNWCAYVSDYPPNATVNGTTYTLHGTSPFTLTASNGTSIQTVNGTTITTSALTITPVTMTDKTECPGVFCAKRDEPHNGRICCVGLTSVGSYCRDLATDGASTYTGCGFEFVGVGGGGSRDDCAKRCTDKGGGWVLATCEQYQCLHAAGQLSYNWFYSSGSYQGYKASPTSNSLCPGGIGCIASCYHSGIGGYCVR